MGTPAKSVLSNDPLPAPFVKWVGGKRQLLSFLVRAAPRSFKRYLEPFLGGGALYFALTPPSAVIADLNQELVDLYCVVRDDVEELINILQSHVYEREYFYSIRNADRSADFASWSKVQRAARLLYLNRTCFNGLYRVNSSGHFNVPFGRYKNPRICDPDNLRACSKALKAAEIRCEDFVATCSRAKRGDFVYLDPPYVPLSTTANFTAYHREGFSLDDHERLATTCEDLTRRGVTFLLSNSSAPFVRERYREFTISEVPALRNINSVASRRGAVTELVVTNSCQVGSS